MGYLSLFLLKIWGLIYFLDNSRLQVRKVGHALVVSIEKE